MPNPEIIRRAQVTAPPVGRRAPRSPAADASADRPPARRLARAASAVPFRAPLAALAFALGLLALPAGGPPAGRAQDGAPRVDYQLEATYYAAPRGLTPAPLDWPEGRQPGGLDRAQDGRVAVTDRSAHQVHVFGAGGALMGSHGAPGGEEGQLGAPRDVAWLPGDRLALSDTVNDRVQVWTADGAFERAWPVEDPQGLVYVDEPGARGLWVLSGAGDALLGYNLTGAQIERFALPPGSGAEQLAFLGAPTVSEGGSARPMARFLVAATGAGLVLDLLARQPRTLLALPEASAVAARWPAAGGPRDDDASPYRWRAYAAAYDAGLGLLEGADFRRQAPWSRPEILDLALAPDGRLLALDADLGPTWLGDEAALLPALRGLGRLEAPRRVGATADALWLADAWPRLQRWSPDGAPEAALALRRPSGAVLAAEDLAAAGARSYGLAADGAVFRLDGGEPELGWRPAEDEWSVPVAADIEYDVIALLDLAGPALRWLDADMRPFDAWPLREDRFRPVADLALGADRVYLADPEAAEVLVYERGGARLGAFPVPAGVRRLSAHPDGHVLVLTDSAWVQAYGPEGDLRGAWPVGGPGARPTDIALDGRLRLWVADARGELRVYRQVAPPAAMPQAPPRPRNGCAIAVDKRAAPAAIDLGGSVEITLRLDGSCREASRVADVVLAVDMSSSMADAGKAAAARAAALRFVAQADPASMRVAVVRFSDEAEVVAPLSSDRAAAAAAIGALGVFGDTDLPAALDASLAALQADVRAGATRAIVLLSDGISRVPGLEESVARLRADGAEVFTIGLGPDADADTLATVASDPAHAFLSPGNDRLAELYGEIGRRIREPELLDRLAIEDRLPENMEWLPGTAMPLAPSYDPAQGLLRWEGAALAALDPVELRYRVRPTEPGTWPTNVFARADVLDGLGERHDLAFPVPEVVVRPPERLYLPLALRERCEPSLRPKAAVLVLDASSSMAGPTGDGITKLEAARRASRAFLEATDPVHDRIALVTFHGEAEIRQPLTSDRALLQAAIDGIELGSGTAVGAGIDAGMQALEARREVEQPVLLLLGDGRAHPEPPSYGVERAAAARAAGATIFAVGLGQDADAETLQAIAGDQSHYRYAPGAAELVAIYRGIAETLPCPADAFWGRR